MVKKDESIEETGYYYLNRKGCLTVLNALKCDIGHMVDFCNDGWNKDIPFDWSDYENWDHMLSAIQDIEAYIQTMPCIDDTLADDEEVSA